MAEPLWSHSALVEAAGGVADGPAPAGVTGLSIDTRTLRPGDAFIALKDQRDGHEFVSQAFEKGAVAALVSDRYPRRPGDGALIRVGDVLEGLRAIARAGRARLAPEARVLAVTGSAGKTTTKDMLRAGLEAVAPGRVHASAKSFNNHWGVPLTLATMPAATRFAVLEIGMNHAGEITPLVGLARPHVAIVLNVLPAHLGHFASVEEIAEAKAEIFSGLIEGGSAIVNGDSPYAGLLRTRASARTSRVLSFGTGPQCDARLASFDGGTGEDPFAPAATRVVLADGGVLDYALAIRGRHIAENSAAALLAVREAGADVATVAAALAHVGASPGRGERSRLVTEAGEILLIDESYNANPASMAAAIATAGAARASGSGRLVLVLGDMLELGEQSVALHRGLAEAIDAARADLVFLCGPHMKELWTVLSGRSDAGRLGLWWRPTSAELEPLVGRELQAGDVVMIKGSNGLRMAPLVAALRSHGRVAI